MSAVTPPVTHRDFCQSISLGGIRTPDPQIRRLLIYLLGHGLRWPELFVGDANAGLL
jgi:hypothetical protein